jgi:hypothetical protein
MLTPRDWTLLVINAAKQGSLEPVQLQKALFLVSRNVNPSQLLAERFYDFSAYDYGPFCGEIYTDAEALERDGLVLIQRPPITRYKLFSITEAGQRRAEELRAKIPERTLDYVERVVAWTRGLTFNQLVSAIYKAYPEMKENSVFQD